MTIAVEEKRKTKKKDFFTINSGHLCFCQLPQPAQLLHSDQQIQILKGGKAKVALTHFWVFLVSLKKYIYPP